MNKTPYVHDLPFHVHDRDSDFRRIHTALTMTLN